MNAHRLQALAALGEARAERLGRELARARGDLERLERQRGELGEHVRRYQRESVAREGGIPPAMLCHRRRFVALLADRVVSLAERAGHGRDAVREIAGRHALERARGLALETLERRAVADESLEAEREEQRLLDESACHGRARRPGTPHVRHGGSRR